MIFYSRRLPHWQPSGKPLFVTWHLHGSLPRNRFPPPGALSAGKAFVWMDRFLDEARCGPTWLLAKQIAQIAANSICYAAETLGYFHLHAYVVMPNHVHLLATPQVEPRKFLQSVKGYSAWEANKLLGRTGEPFWQSESYDRWVRDDAEFGRIRAYIEDNPVKAGLTAEPGRYRWSSAYAGSKAVVAG